MNETKQSTSTLTIITIVFLIFFFPIGLLLMWFKTYWPKPVKLIVSAFLALLLFGNAYAFGHTSPQGENQPAIIKAPLTVTLAPSKRPTTTPTLTLTPTRSPYIPPTAQPTYVTPTFAPTAPFVNSQQAVQNGNGATALCVDGTYSYADHDQGACSHHQGVKQFYK